MPRGIYERKKKPTRMSSYSFCPVRKTTPREDRELMESLQQAAMELESKRCPNCHLDMSGDRCDACGFYFQRVEPTAYDPRAPFWRRVVNNMKRME